MSIGEVLFFLGLFHFQYYCEGTSRTNYRHKSEFSINWLHQTLSSSDAPVINTVGMLKREIFVFCYFGSVLP